MRVVVTVLAGALAYDGWERLMRADGPERALLLLWAAIGWAIAVAAVVWAWKRHPF